MNDHRMSENFFDYEFRCKCGCGRVHVHELLIESLEVFRSVFDRQVYVLSGCRCWLHNLCEGGLETSKHLVTDEDGRNIPCMAADVYVARMRPRQMFKAALKVPAFNDGGIGIYEAQGFIHLDVRGIKARWFVKEKGADATGIPRNYY